MSDKIINLQQTNKHDDYKLISNRAKWKEVLALYVVKISNGNNTNEVITMDEKRKNELKKIFEDMHKITYEMKKEKGDELIFKDHISIVEKVENNIVYTIEGNSTDDMCRQKEYSMSSKFILGYGIP